MNKKIIIIFNLLFVWNAMQSQTLTFNQNSIGTIFLDNNLNGTAFVIGEDNLVVTSAHVIDTTKSIYFRKLHDSTLFKLKLYKQDIANDIALLKCDQHLSNFPFKIYSSPIQLGEKIYYLGYNSAILTPNEPTIAFSYGFVSSLGTTWANGISVNFIEFIGSGIPGYSGSPILTQEGKVFGVMTQAFLRRGIKGGKVDYLNRASFLNSILDNQIK